tara:strand:- start:4680 stop:4997 length:318 start_codon:yes stop_codon:yes gene_type:complete
MVVSSDKTVTLIPYFYAPPYSDKVYNVWVIAKDKHPDPLNLMTWGYAKLGGDVVRVSDFNRFFERSGDKKATLGYSIRGASTAFMEKERMLRVIYGWVRSRRSKP